MQMSSITFRSGELGNSCEEGGVLRTLFRTDLVFSDARYDDQNQLDDCHKGRHKIDDYHYEDKPVDLHFGEVDDEEHHEDA